jgi:hypothetical protein
MRRSVRHASVLGVAVLVLTACASSAPKPGSSTSDVRVVARSAFAGQPDAGDVFPAVSGGFGQQPHVAAKAEDTPRSPSVLYLSEGTGDRVASRGALEVRYVKTDWTSGEVLHDSWASGIASEKLPSGDADIAIRGLLNYVRIGSRVEIVNPGASGITVFVVDVLAQGAPSASPTG